MSDHTISTIEQLAEIAILDGNLYIIPEGNLTITEKIEIPGLLLYAGSLVCEKGLVSAGDMYISGSVSVSGDLYCNYLMAAGISISGDLTILEECNCDTADVSVGGVLVVGYFIGTGDENNLTVGGNCYVGSAVSNILTVGGDIFSSGWMTIHGELNVSGNCTCYDNIVCSGNINVGGIYCTGDITCANGSVVVG